MTKTYQIKINQGKDAKMVDIPQAGPKGEAVTVKAVQGARYQLVDPQTGFGPENIRASRQGKDLKVSFEGSQTTDLVVENYYAVTPEGYNGLIGEAESGRFYEYIPESAVGLASVPMLADSGQVVGMALGGAEVTPSGAAVGVLAAGLFSPWLAGAGALVAAAAGGGGGGGGGAAKDTKAVPVNSVKINIDANDDGLITAAEKGTAITTSVTAQLDKTKVVAGDVVTFSDGTKSESVTLKDTDINNGFVTTTGWSIPGEGIASTISAVLKDLAGNVSDTVKDMVTRVIDTLKTALTIDPISGNNIIDSIEGNTTPVAVTGKVSGAFAGTEDVTLVVNGTNYTGKLTNGSYSIPVSMADLKTDSDTVIEGHVTGTNGSFATASQSYLVEGQNNTKSTAILINPIADDNMLNMSEAPAGGSQTITGKVTGSFALGDTVTLKANGVNSTGAIDKDGNYSIAVKISDLLADADTIVDATVIGTGGSSAKALQDYGFDILAPDKLALTIDLDKGVDGLYKDDRYINSTEKDGASTTSLTASFDPTKVSIGDVITFSDGTTTKTVTLDKGAVDAGSATSTGWSLPLENGKLNVTAILTDAAGNTSKKASDEAAIDITAATVSPQHKHTDFKLDTFGFKSNETGTYKLHLGKDVFTELTLPKGGKLLVSTDTPIQAKDIFFEHWDVAGNLSTTYLVDVDTPTLYTVTSNTTFVV